MKLIDRSSHSYALSFDMAFYRYFFIAFVLFAFAGSVAAQRATPPGAALIGKETGRPGQVYLRKTPSTQEVEIQWKGVEGATRYVVELYKRNNKLMLRYRVPESKISVNLRPGQYSIRVAALNKFGARGLWSDRAPVKVYKKDGLAPEHIQERIEVLAEVKESIVEETGRGRGESFGIGASEIFGIGFEYGIPNIGFAEFEDFYGVDIFFRYHRFFVENLKPEINLSFMHGVTNDPALEAITLMRLFLKLHYSIPLFDYTFFLVPRVGLGYSLVSLSSPYIGANYFPVSTSAGIELSYEPANSLRIFFSYDFVYIIMDETMQFHIPSAGIMLKF